MSIPTSGPGPLRIDNFPIEVNKEYAARQKGVDKLIESGMMSISGGLEISFAHAARIQAIIPLLSQLALLMGTFIKTSIALFVHDPSVDSMRSASPYMTPSLGPIEKREKDLVKVAELMTKMPVAEQARAAVIVAALQQTIAEDRMVDFVRGKMAELTPA